MNSKLNLDFSVVEQARNSAKNIALDIQQFIDKHTTVAVERTVVRLLGIDGVDDIERPLPNVVLEHIKEIGGLAQGASFWIGNAMIQTGKSPQEIAEGISTGEIDLSKLAQAPIDEIKEAINKVAVASVDKIQANREQRDNYLKH